MRNTKIKEEIIQYKNKSLIFLSCETMIINIYILIEFLNFYNVAMINKNILKIRKDLDKLDNSLLKIIKKRAKLVDLVLKNKRYKKDIIDKKRINIILKNISKKSKKMKIDPLITKKIWASMIKAFIDYEFRNFKK